MEQDDQITEQAERYVLGALSRKEAEAFEDKCLICPRTLQAALDANLMVDSLRQASEERLLADRSVAKQSPWHLNVAMPWTGVAASCLAVLLAIAWAIGPFIGSTDPVQQRVVVDGKEPQERLTDPGQRTRVVQPDSELAPVYTLLATRGHTGPPRSDPAPGQNRELLLRIDVSKYSIDTAATFAITVRSSTGGAILNLKDCSPRDDNTIVVAVAAPVVRDQLSIVQLLHEDSLLAEYLLDLRQEGTTP